MKILTVLLTLILTSFYSIAEVVVVVHPSNTNELDSSSISRIFLGKSKSFPNGETAIPLNLPENESSTEDFNNKVLNKSANQLKAYWSKLVFTGKGTPPQEVLSDADVIKLVANNPNSIGYINASSINDSIKVVAKF